MQVEHSIQDYLETVGQGIVEKFGAGKPKRVIIVGAGLAGLAAGYELKRAGHTPIILEAQQRVGGRVYTLRDPFTEGLYAEVGAMRIPRAHSLTMAYIEKFGLNTNHFTMDNPNAYYYMGGKKVRASEAARDRLCWGSTWRNMKEARPPGRCMSRRPSRCWRCSKRMARRLGRRSLRSTTSIPRANSWN